MKQTLRHTEAFEYYYLLGDERNLDKVADKFNVSLTSAKKWSQVFGWQDRLLERDRLNTRSLEDRTDFSIVEEKVYHLEQIQVFLFKARQDFEKGKLKCRNISDVDKLIRLQIFLAGESSENNTVTSESIDLVINFILLIITKYVKDQETLRKITQELHEGIQDSKNTENL